MNPGELFDKGYNRFVRPNIGITAFLAASVVGIGAYKHFSQLFGGDGGPLSRRDLVGELDLSDLSILAGGTLGGILLALYTIARLRRN